MCIRKPDIFLPELKLNTYMLFLKAFLILELNDVPDGRGVVVSLVAMYVKER
jgi:hypothetical protein